MDKPKTLADLQVFYVKKYRPLYDRFNSAHLLPQEVHAEVAAAFDHLFRKDYQDGECDPENFERAIGHLKRATFDSFKLTFESEIRDRFNRFMHARYANVDNGKFIPKMCALFNKAQKIAEQARNLERGDNIDYPAWSAAFEKWNEILPIADAMAEEENSEKIQRIENPRFVDYLRDWGKFLWGILVGVLFTKLFEFVISKIHCCP